MTYLYDSEVSIYIFHSLTLTNIHMTKYIYFNALFIEFSSAKAR